MKKFTRNAAAAITAAVLTVAGAAPCFSQTTMTANSVDTNNDDWLHAEGSRLYDMNGNEVIYSMSYTIMRYSLSR